MTERGGLARIQTIECVNGAVQQVSCGVPQRVAQGFVDCQVHYKGSMLYQFVQLYCHRLRRTAPELEERYYCGTWSCHLVWIIVSYECLSGLLGEQDANVVTKVLKPHCLETGGYEFSGECRDIDWCLNPSTCGDHGVCVEGHLDYTCDCEVVFEAVSISNGQKCDEINVYVDRNGHGSRSLGTCNDLINGFSCSSPTGYKIGAIEHGQTCEVKVCGEAPAVGHSMRNDTSPIVFGSSVEYHCDTTNILMKGFWYKY